MVREERDDVIEDPDIMEEEDDDEEDDYSDAPFDCAGGEGDVDARDIVATDMNAPRRVVGDFEVLRLAKRGDAESCLSFATHCRVDLKSFADNSARNALHYAADSGCLPLIERLKQYGVPITDKDAKGLTPADIACINRHSEDVVKALGGASRPREELLVQLAPKPPAFTVSRPAPPAPQRSDASTFWGKTTALHSEAREGLLEVRCEGVNATEVVDKVWHGLQLTYAPPSGSLDSWRLPLSKDTLSAHPGDFTVITAEKKGGELVGQLLCWKPMGSNGKEHHVDPSTSSSPSFSSLAWAGLMGVVATAQHQGVATKMMSRLHGALKECLGARHVVFTVPQSPLPTPPAYTCVIKVFRRSLDPLRVLQSKRGEAAEFLYSEYYDTDSVLRVDTVLKESASAALRRKVEAQVEKEWVVLKTQEESASLLAYLQKSSGAGEVRYRPESLGEVTALFLSSPGVVTCVRRSQGNIEDVVVFRLRRPTAEEGKDDVVLAEVIFAMLPSFKPGPEKIEFLLFLAEAYASQADTLLVPALFGITDSDVVKCQFTECSALRRLLYVVDTHTGEPVPALPPSKVFLPLLF